MSISLIIRRALGIHLEIQEGTYRKFPVDEETCNWSRGVSSVEENSAPMRD